MKDFSWRVQAYLESSYAIYTGIDAATIVYSLPSISITTASTHQSKSTPISSKMQLTNIITAFSLASAASACVDFGASINGAQYATISLNDNGRKTCEFTGYGGDNKGWSRSLQMTFVSRN